MSFWAMNFESFTRYSVTAASIFLILGLYHQVYKMFKTKSASDFSYMMLIALVAAELAWLNYGHFLGEWPILAMTYFELPASLLALYGRYKFGTLKNA